jgi:hypothetical protein
VDKLELCELMMAVDSVFGGSLHLDPDQFVLQAFILLIRQVLVQITFSCFVAARECQPHFGTLSVFVVDFPLAVVLCKSSLLVKAQRSTRINISGLHHV